MLNFNQSPSAEQIASWLEVLIEQNSKVEIRVLRERGAPTVQHHSADSLLEIAKQAIRLSPGAKGIYWLLNPLPISWQGTTAKDVDIERRRWLLIDCDPRRTGVVSSTDDEKEAARLKMIEVGEYLSIRGWPAPIIADSGNGWHLLYRIDLPGDDGGLVHRVLMALDRRFSNQEISIDTKVGNASRICKLYGTLAAKGPNTAERPHRFSGIVSIPEDLVVVPIELLQSIADYSNRSDAAIRDCGLSKDTSQIASGDDAVHRARQYLAKMQASISGQHGHDRLLHAASVLVNDFGLADDMAIRLLATEFNPRCLPPWDESEIERKVAEAKKKPPARPSKLAASNSRGEASNPRTNRRSQAVHSEAIVVRLSEVEEREVEWLWPNRIPLGKLTLLAGDPGLGKSFVTVDMAARVSTGRGWPDCFDQGQMVGSVVMFNCEDDTADTIVPRLKNAGGDPTKVMVFQGVVTIDSEAGTRHQRGFSLDVDLPKLIEVLKSNPDVRLVVIDPISAYCGATDSHKNADVRAMLAPMADMAAKYRVAVVMVTHLAKGAGGKAVYRAMGSLAFSAAARVVWHVAKDHKDDNRRLILLAKMNVAEEATGLAYCLEDCAVCWEEGSVEMTADEHLAQESESEISRRGRERGEAVGEARGWLVSTLSNRSIRATTIDQMADDADISKATLKRAKKLEFVISKRVGFGEASVVWWTLAEPDDEAAIDSNLESMSAAEFS